MLTVSHKSVKTETAENTDQGPKYTAVLSESKDVAQAIIAS